MVSLTGIKSGTVVNLVMDTPLLGKIEHVEVLATGGYKIAKSYSDVDVMHSEIYSSLETPNVSDDLRAYTYIIIEGRDGKPTAYADVWLKKITVVNTLMAAFKMPIDSLDDLAILRGVLQSRGYTPEITIIEN